MFEYMKRFLKLVNFVAISVKYSFLTFKISTCDKNDEGY